MRKKKIKNHQSSHFLLIHKKNIFVNNFPELQINLNYVNSKKKKEQSTNSL